MRFNGLRVAAPIPLKIDFALPILTSDKIGKTYMHTLCGQEDMDVIVTTEQTD